MQGVTEEQASARWREIASVSETLSKRTDTEGGFNVPTGSSLGGDNRASDPYQTSHSFVMTFTAGVDHLHAVTSLVVDHQQLHVSAPASLARGILENVATAFWMLHSPSRDERVTRTLRWQAQNFRDQHKALDAMSVTPNKSLEDKLKQVDVVADRRGLDKQIVRGGYRSTAVVTYADANTSGALGVLVPWQICSGFAHGRPWAHLGVSSQEHHESSDPKVANVRLTNDLARSLYPVQAAVDLMEETLRLFELRRQ